MLLIHVPKITNRLGYTLNVVFRYILHAEFSITTDVGTFEAHEDAKLSYGKEPVDKDVPFVKAVDLLFETSIEEQELRPFKREGMMMLYPTYGGETALPFDPFAASFYMLSRYEEYLPHRTDEHGRFVTTESVASKYGFLEQAVVDRWALSVKEVIERHYPKYHFAERKYEFIETVDIDAAYCYQNKGVGRTVMGTVRDVFRERNMENLAERYKVLVGKKTDPYDTFDYILATTMKHTDIHLVFFVLLGDYGVYDKPISYHNDKFQELLKHLCDHAKMGIHPSYNTQEEPHKIDVEMKRLSDILHRRIVRSRNHFLRLQLPNSYRSLIRAGIKHDYSMGYADSIGYRAGTATPYPFFDLGRDSETLLMIHPFVLMDTTLQKYMVLKPDEATEAIKTMVDEARAVGGTFCCIWHNQNLCESFGWEGWRKVYEEMIEYASNN